MSSDSSDSGQSGGTSNQNDFVHGFFVEIRVLKTSKIVALDFG